ncbi:MAG: thioredoxin family protein [Prevotella sp.]|nr:thioredoxin family protein [Prevotella sp.]
MKRTLFLTIMGLFSLMAWSQMVDPVHFSAQLKTGNSADAEIVFSATIDKGWHVYSTDMGDNGPTSATFNVVKLDGVELVGKLTPRGNVTTQYDKMFDMELRFFENKAMFVQKIRFTKPQYVIDCFLEYGACNDEMCMPPTQVELKKKGDSPVAKESSSQQDTTQTEQQSDTTSVQEKSETEVSDSIADASLSNIQNTDDNGSDEESTSWWLFFFQGLLGGFLALFTPCVWPIIPMTVSFFLKRNKERSKGIREAVTYGLSIIVIYVLLGLVVTLLFGASALNALATNAVFNIFFCLLLVVFAASFFGAFELTLPSSWSNKIDQKSEATTGLLSIFLMAFTLALVSFSCTGPIIGFLLVAVSTQGSIVAPTIGMLGFAIALAIPFTLFALFPSLLKSAPKSGGWMNVVKVTLGFIELAFALKFFSVADLAYGWHLLDREVFISLWIIIFGCLGFYLLGWLKLPHDDDNRHISVPRLFVAMASLAFTVYMIPGLWGAPLKAISAFTPPMSTQDFRLQSSSVVTEAQYRDYDLGMEAARQQGKPVLLDFTGYGCVNCRKMEAAVWTNPRVAEIIKNRYVLISLYVDDKTSLPEPIEITENGQKRTLRTVGDKWSYLQRSKFGANAQPFYVLLDSDGHQLASPRSYDEDVDAYVEFLNEGLRNK